MPLFRKKKETELESQVQELENLQASTAGIAEELSVAKRNIEIQKAKDEAILRSIAEGIIVTDQSGKIIKLSESVPTLLGFAEAELMGKNLSDAIKIEDEKENPVSPENRLSSKALAEKKAVDAHLNFVRKDGTKFFAHSVASPIIFEGEPIGVIEVFRDETKEREVDRMKTEFVSLASHQLKAPLSAIIGYSSMLLEGSVGELEDKQKELLDYVSRSAVNMVSLISDFLNVTKLETGHIIVNPEPTDLKNFVQGLIDEVKPAAEAKQCKVVFEASEDFTGVPVDRKLLSQVVHNLLTNAIKYSKAAPDGEVHVELKREAGEIVLKVADNGIGIPKDEQSKIFSRLYRATNAIEAQAEGTGLGLYLAKLIVESAGGRIWFESEKNQGTIFSVALPETGMKSISNNVNN